MLAVAQAAEVQPVSLTKSASGSSNLVSIMAPTSSYMRTQSTIKAGTASFIFSTAQQFREDRLGDEGCLGTWEVTESI